MSKDKAPKIYYADGEFFGLTENRHDHLRPIAFVEHKAYAALEAKLAEKEVELLGLKEGLEHLKYSVEQCSLAANVYRSKLAECVAAIQYVMANNDKIKGWDKLHDAFYGAKK